jgi:hypothetical protein
LRFGEDDEGVEEAEVFRNDLGAGLASPSLDGGFEEFPRRLPQPGPKLSDPLPRSLQFRPRIGQLTTQRDDPRGKHLIAGASMIGARSRTPWDEDPLRPAFPTSSACRLRSKARQAATER